MTNKSTKIVVDPWNFSAEQLALPRTLKDAVAAKSKLYLPFDDATGEFRICGKGHFSARWIYGNVCDACWREREAKRKARSLAGPGREPGGSLEDWSALMPKIDGAKIGRLRAERIQKLESSLSDGAKWAAPFLGHWAPRRPRKSLARRKAKPTHHWILSYNRIPIRPDRYLKRATL